MSLKLTIVTPQKLFLEKQVDQVNLMTPKGEIGILPEHTDLTSLLSQGSSKIRIGQRIETVKLGNGFVEVTDDLVTVFASFASSS